MNRGGGASHSCRGETDGNGPRERGRGIPQTSSAHTEGREGRRAGQRCHKLSATPTALPHRYKPRRSSAGRLPNGGHSAKGRGRPTAHRQQRRPPQGRTAVRRGEQRGSCRQERRRRRLGAAWALAGNERQGLWSCRRKSADLESPCYAPVLYSPVKSFHGSMRDWAASSARERPSLDRSLRGEVGGCRLLFLPPPPPPPHVTAQWPRRARVLTSGPPSTRRRFRRRQQRRDARRRWCPRRRQLQRRRHQS